MNQDEVRFVQLISSIICGFVRQYISDARSRGHVQLRSSPTIHVEPPELTLRPDHDSHQECGNTKAAQAQGPALAHEEAHVV